MIYTDLAAVPPDLLKRVNILERKQGKRVGKNKRRYLDIVAAFDIETTRLSDDESIMYVWQLQVGLKDTIIGRTWDEFFEILHRLTDELDENVYLVTYIQNLAFEFAFLSGVYPFEPEEVFAVMPRIPLRADMLGHIELRCSYKHTNMRLETFLSKMGVPNQKLTYDYEKLRYPWTPLTDDEIDYCINDVKGLVQAIYAEMAHDGDTLYTIPATSTGYVRRDVKAALRRMRYGVIKGILPDFETYTLLREAMRGGNTHANRYYAKQIINDVHSVDMKSAYPATELLDRFPMGPFRTAKDFTVEEFYDLMRRRKKAILARVSFSGICLKDRFDGCPYISKAKCRQVYAAALDNGRILEAAYLETTITDVDFRIIEATYKWDDMTILHMEHARYGLLPDMLKSVIMDYFDIKTNEKGLMREKAKNKLNSIYGMMATSPVKDEIIYHGPGQFDYAKKPAPELLDEANRKAFIAYQWGCWTTANVRYRLWRGIEEVKRQGGEFIYCDTDSIKYTGDVDFGALNDEIIQDSVEGGYYVDDKDGVRNYVGVWEYEGKYEAFATRGAKKYAYIKDGGIKAVISGVPTREDGNHVSGGMILEREGGLDAFLRDVLVFDNKTTVIYNDTVDRYIKIGKNTLHITPCVTISPGEYTLKDTAEYLDVVELSREALYHYRRDILGKNF